MESSDDNKKEKQMRLKILTELNDWFENTKWSFDESNDEMYADMGGIDEKILTLKEGQEEAFKIMFDKIKGWMKEIKLKRRFIFETTNTFARADKIRQILQDAKIYGTVTQDED
tara:strand:- start:153 stop:494 length:342 start_codon:yes stop_codon:yes gene_type:complete